jgi:23S rRNA (pseudouridine1915-N3)-methyltransferase
MQIVCVTPWKLTGTPARSWSEELLKRIERSSAVSIVAPSKSLDGERAVEQFLVKECEKIIQERGCLYFLDERGQNLTSEQFAEELTQLRDRATRQLGFVFGGAYGLPAGLAPFLKNGRLISLSRATFAHELSLVVLLEQIYRAECIRAKHPYHHGGLSPLAELAREQSPRRK